MNNVDIGIIVILAVGFLAGLRAGFIVEVAGILGALLAFAVAKAEYHPVRHVLAAFAPKSPWLTPIAYLLVFLAVWGLILLAARLIRRVARLLMLGPLDRLGGAILGLAQSAVVLELLLYIAKHAPNHTLRVAIKHSTLAPTFLWLAPHVNHYLPHLPHY